MADETPADSNSEIWTRTTAPQSPYTSRQIVIGLLVLLIGLLVVFGLPMVLL